MKVAVVLIRSAINSSGAVKHTLKLLGLVRKNTCVVFENSPARLGMIRKVKDYVTWGVINSEIEVSLNLKDGCCSLHPPRGGFEKKGIKIPFNVGGALGNRKDKIGVLLKRMSK